MIIKKFFNRLINPKETSQNFDKPRYEALNIIRCGKDEN